MTDRARIIAALRAKARSTTFPAERDALNAKADELAAAEPERPRYEGSGVRNWTMFDDSGHIDWDAVEARLKQEGERWMAVRDINGNEHRERIW